MGREPAETGHVPKNYQAKIFHPCVRRGLAGSPLKQEQPKAALNTRKG